MTGNYEVNLAVALQLQVEHSDPFADHRLRLEDVLPPDGDPWRRARGDDEGQGCPEARAEGESGAREVRENGAGAVQVLPEVPRHALAEADQRCAGAD